MYIKLGGKVLWKYVEDVYLKIKKKLKYLLIFNLKKL